MMYSVWDHAHRRYNYYRSPDSSAATSAPKPEHLRTEALGMSPERAAWPLPSNARIVGTGKYPKGFIASKESRAGLGFDLSPRSTTGLLVYGALALAAYSFWGKK